MTDAHIPYGGYWSTPFCKWQRSLAHLNSVKLAGHVAKHALEARGIAPDVFDHAVLGMTVPQEKSFWGVPWLGWLIGHDRLAGPTVAQACATGARSLAVAAGAVAEGEATASLVVTCDRTSNGPVMIYPDPQGASGAPRTENWMLDNFADDPVRHTAVIETAENVARDWQIGTEEQHEVVLRRYEQYQDALKDDRAFHRRFMTLPLALPDAGFRRTVATVEGDEGITQTSREALARLKPVREGGTLTFGGQTHPADGNAAIIVTGADRARELSRDPGIAIRILAFGQARERFGYMPAAPIPAARQALERAGLALDRIDAIKSHNPFVVNDIVFARETGADVMRMNNYGSSLVFGHPQGPTGMRLIIELIEELVQRGGGRGLFQGCAAGDSAMAVVVEVTGGS